MMFSSSLAPSKSGLIIWGGSANTYFVFILIFTHKQWKSVQAGEFVVSAASIGPGELDLKLMRFFQPWIDNPDRRAAFNCYRRILVAAPRVLDDFAPFPCRRQQERKSIF